MASSIVTSTTKQLGGLVVKEAKYLYEVSDKIKRLQHDLQWMLCFLEDADNRQNREKVVALWVSTIREFTYEAEEIVESYVHKVSNPRQNGGSKTIIKWWLCALCDARALHEVGSNVDDLRIRIGELISRLQMYGVKVTKEDERTTNIYVRQTYSHVEDDPIGLEEHIRQVVEQLVPNKPVNVVGICGMGGLGKTTLARQVVHDIRTKEHFNGRSVWVCISKQFETRKVFVEILTGLTNAVDAKEREKISSLTDGKLPQEICRVLSQHVCLVVLDDLWKYDDWSVLKSAFESIESSSSKIMITTRKNGLIKQIDPLGYSHNLNHLNGDDSWKLFRRITFSEKENLGNKKGSSDYTAKDGEEFERDQAKEPADSEEIGSHQIEQDEDMNAKEELGREMLKHCKGLPLAILTLGGVLSNKKTLVEWQNVQKNIKIFLMGDSKQTTSYNSKELFAVLELSYNDLSYYLKPCFMYLGHFPEDYEIWVDRLYHLWEAEGLVTNSKEDEDLGLDEIAESYLNELVERCLVQVGQRWANGRIRTCRLHDVTRFMCLRKCKDVNFLKTVSVKDSLSRKEIASSSSINVAVHRYVLYLDDAIISDGSLPFGSIRNIAPCIRSLLVFQKRQCSWNGVLFTSNIRKCLSLLRVLDLDGVDIPIHPMAIKDLIHLRYLRFNGARIHGSVVPYIWDCNYLETLNLHILGTVSLSNKLWRLERLKHLKLPGRMKLKGRKRFITLTENQLEQLETLQNYSSICFEMKNLWKMTSMRVFTFRLFDYLTREKVGHFLKLPMIATKRRDYPLRLGLEADVINGDTSLLTTLVSHACISELDIKGRIEDVSSLQIFDKRYLTQLILEGAEIGQQGISMLEKLPLLTQLYICRKSYVDKKMSFSGGGFPQLMRLYLDEMDVEEWEISEGAVPNLQYLNIDNCKGLKMIPSGLRGTVRIECNPCISGIENFNTCRYYAKGG